jgi:hypothetical protein
MPVPPFRDDVNCDLDEEKPAKTEGVRPSDLIIGTAALLPIALKLGKTIRDKVGNGRRDRAA